jgi:hypothetical protein
MGTIATGGLVARYDEQSLETGLTTIKSLSEAIVVKDATTCLTAKTAQRDVRNYMKDVHLKLDPFVESAKRNLQSAKDELNKWLAPAEAIDNALALKVKEYERQERERTERERAIEQERIRVETERKAAEERKVREQQAEEDRKRRQKEIEEARKAGELKAAEANRLKKQAEEDAAREKAMAREQEAEAAKNVPVVKVEAAIPTVAGVPSRRNWKFRIVDANKIPRAYLQPNEVAIGQFVRNLKKAGEVIPGVEAYED